MSGSPKKSRREKASRDGKAAAASEAERPAEEGRPAPARRFWMREYLEALLIAGIFLGFSNTFIIKTFYIPSESMVDTLLVGDHLFVNRQIYGRSGAALEGLLPSRSLQRGDIVIFRSPKDPQTDLVKRCIGLPGDRIELIDKRLYVNGEPVDDGSFTQHTDPRIFPNKRFLSRETRLRDNFLLKVVPEDHFFFLGDNRDESYDSRYWGAVPQRYIKGRALMIYWSFGGETPDGTWPGPLAKVKQVLNTAQGFFSQTRWERTFHVVR
ncbi:MAG: signal peptidase I [Acidobacteriota bacterium]